MRKIKGEKAVIILVFVVSQALKEDMRSLLDEILNMLPRSNIIEM